LKGTQYKWLDLAEFAKRLLRPDHEIVAVKYFTAPIKTHPHDLAAIDRQKIYLQALAAQPLVETILGFYSKNKTLAPAVEEKCRVCDIVHESGFVPVVKLEEKRSDVNIAVEMMADAFQSKADWFCLITGDSDQVGTIEAIRYRLGRQVLVFNPHESLSVMLKTAASYYKNIPRDLPARCQLPLEVPYGKNGKTVKCPEAWRS